MDNLELHIDDPIKKSVVGLALLGFKPVFSCCGFSYKGESVKKSHMTGKPYIYLDANLDIEHKELLFDIARQSFWTIGFPGSGTYIDFYSPLGKFERQDHPWSSENSPHNCEPAVLTIAALERVLATKSSQFTNSVEIIDGNYIYKEIYKIKNWQYPVSLPWIVTPDTFNSL